MKDASARLHDLARTLKKICNISRSQSMESLVVNDRYFKFNPEINREPVKIRKNGVIWQKLGERVANRAAALCTRWSCLITFLGKPLVKLWCNKSLNKKLGCIKDEMFTNEPNFTEWISAHCCHPWGTRHTQRFVQENSNVTCCWWSQHSVITNMNMLQAGRWRCNWDDITRSSALSFFKSGLFRSIHMCQFLVHRRLPTLAQFRFIKGWRLQGTIVLDDSQFSRFNLSVNSLCLKGRPKWKIRPEFFCSTSLLYKILPIHLVACKPAVYTFYTSHLRQTVLCGAVCLS